MTFGLSISEDETLVATGDLDANSVSEFDAAVGRVASHGVRELIVDITDVTFVDSAGLAALVRATHHAPVTLRSPCPPVRRTLELGGVDRVLTILG
jgi:anti-anti-sigma factor